MTMNLNDLAAVADAMFCDTRLYRIEGEGPLSTQRAFSR
jgi:hypothetical protein